MPKERKKKKKGFIIFFFLNRIDWICELRTASLRGSTEQNKTPLAKKLFKIKYKNNSKICIFFLLSFVQINTGNTVGVKGTKKFI